MRSGVLSLDNILSAVNFFAGKRNPELKGNQSRDLLRYLLCRLFDQGHGCLMGAQITLAQGTLAIRLGLSRQWVGILLNRLQAAGLIEYYAPVLPGGMRASCNFRIGGQLQRILIMLVKSKRGKTHVKSDAKDRWQFSPSSKEEERILKIRERENTPPRQELLDRSPTLNLWWERAKAFIERQRGEGKTSGENTR
jgi:hypothetical protein